jgi:16S rRNA (guanine(1405)-N(7))-methyltransferase
MGPGEVPGQDLLAGLATGHISTAERLPFLTEFHEALFAGIGTPATVLDLGCGVYPVLFPFDAEGASVSAYVAADKDPGSIRALDSYARVRGDGRLTAVAFDISDGWAVLRDRTGQSRFDVAFLFKLVPVLRRQASAAYQLLTTISADLVVLTGSTRSMTKNQSIERRERAALLAFAEAAGLRVRAEAACGGECVVVASR